MPAPSTPVVGWARDGKILSPTKFLTTWIIADNQNLKSWTLLSLDASNELQTATNGDILVWVSHTELSVDTNTYSKTANYRLIHEDDTYVFPTADTLTGATIGNYYAFNSDHQVVVSTWRAKFDLKRCLQLVEILSAWIWVFRIIPVSATDTLLTTTTVITSAQVLTSFTTPIELVPAPWAWKAIRVESIIATVDYNSAAYATNTTLEARYTNWSGTKVSADIAWLLTATADKYVSVGGLEAELVLTANAPVVVRTATGNPATGNSPITVTVNYRIVSL